MKNTVVIACVNVQLFHFVVSHVKKPLINWENQSETSTTADANANFQRHVAKCKQQTSKLSRFSLPKWNITKRTSNERKNRMYEELKVIRSSYFQNYWEREKKNRRQHIENMSSIVHKKKKTHSTKSGYSANGAGNNSSTIIHCNGKSSGKKLYHKNDELSLHPQSHHHQRYKSASAASTGTRILHKRHNIVR